MRYIKLLYYKLLRILNPLLAKSRFLTHLRFFLLPEGFIFEEFATINGIREFEKREKKESNIYILRRNIHRLEKGLTYQKRRKKFALDYILETIRNFKKLIEEVKLSNQDYKWAFNILETYFNEVEHDDIRIRGAYDIFKGLNAKEVERYSLKPKQQSNLIRFDDFEKFAFNRRSVRLYQPKKVPRELLDKAIETAIQAPSACNRQPFEFRIYDDREMINKIASIPFGTAGFVENFYCFILVVGKLDAYFHSRDRHAIYIDASLALMGLIFALESQGLSSCIYNWPSLPRTEKQIRKQVSLENYEMIVTTLSVGYAREDCLVPSSIKKDLEQIRNYNKL